MIKRGEIYWIHLDPTVGAEIRKRRPGLIVSNDINNIHADTVTILPLSQSTSKVYPFEVLLRAGTYGNEAAAKVKASQIRTIDKRRLGNLLGMLSSKLMLPVDEAMRLHLAL